MKRFFAFLLIAVMLSATLISCDQEVVAGIIKSEIIDGELWITYSNDPNSPVSLGKVMMTNGQTERVIVDIDIIDGYLWITYNDTPDSPVKIGRVSDTLRLPDITDLNSGNVNNSDGTDSTDRGGNTNNDNNSNTQKPTDQYDQDPLHRPVDWNTLDFQGEQVTVLVRNDEKFFREWEREDVGDDELDLAVANRNDVVEEAFNIDFQVLLAAGSEFDDWKSTFCNRIAWDVDNNLHDIDMVANYGFNGLAASFRDYYADVNDKDMFPYFNFKLACWNQSIINNGTINEKLYGIAGDVNLSMFDSAMVIWHNKDLYDKLKTDEDPLDIQDLAVDGDWTYAELYKWSSYYKKSDEGKCFDTYGIYLPNTAEIAEAVPAAFNLTLMSKSSSDTYSYNFIGNTKASDAVGKWKTLIGGAGNAALGKECYCEFGIKSHFVNGDVLFEVDTLYASKEYNNALRTMEDRYSILPLPKYYDGQAKYQTVTQGYMNVVSVLNHERSSVKTKGEAISAYFQYATEYSYTHVRGYYFERIIKPKFFGTDNSDGRVTKSVYLFVRIVDNLVFDFATIYSPMLEDVVKNVWCESIVSGGTLAENYNKNKSDYDEALVDLYFWFGIT